MTQTRILIKIGGRAFEDGAGFKELAASILGLQNTQVIIVHGGGSEISQALKNAGRETKFIDGIRVTEKEDIEIVEHILSETINSRIAGYLQEAGLSCARMSGKTGGLLIAGPISRKGHQYGFVGQINKVNPKTVWDALLDSKVPVVSPISGDENGNSYNINADSAASALAIGAQCTDLIYFTDVPGVKSVDEILPSLSIEQAKILIINGVIKDGMVAKMESAFEALNSSVQRVHISNWQGKTTLQKITNHSETAGTIIHK